jgi:hypothetical protein
LNVGCQDRDFTEVSTLDEEGRILVVSHCIPFIFIESLNTKCKLFYAKDFLPQVFVIARRETKRLTNARRHAAASQSDFFPAPAISTAAKKSSSTKLHNCCFETTTPAGD